MKEHQRFSIQRYFRERAEAKAKRKENSKILCKFIGNWIGSRIVRFIDNNK